MPQRPATKTSVGLRLAADKADLLEAIRMQEFGNDQELQLKTLENAFRLADDDTEQVLSSMARRLGVNIHRLRAIRELESTMDRAKALGLPPDRQPQRLDEDKIFPTTGWFGRYLSWAEPTSAPLAFHFWSAASLIAAAARRNFWVDAGMDEPVYLCNYFFLVGPSGCGKSVAVKKAKDILRRTNVRLSTAGLKRNPPQDLTIYRGAGSATASSWLDSFVTHYTALVPADNGSEEGDSSGELEPAMVLRPDCCCYIAQDEAVVLFGKSAFESERWFDVLFQLSDCPEEWEDDKLVAKQAGKERELYNVALTCLFGSAPEHLISRVSSAIFTGGFIGRTIFSYRPYPSKTHSSRADTDPISAETLADQLAKLAQMPRQRLYLSREAREWYDSYLEDNHERIQQCDPRFVGSYGRAGWHICKVAGILTLAECIQTGVLRPEIPTDRMKHARDLVELERPGAELIVGSVRPSTEAEQILAVEREIGRAGEIDYTTLFQRCRYAVSVVPRFNLFLDTLLQSGRIQRRREGKLWILRSADNQESDW